MAAPAALSAIAAVAEGCIAGYAQEAAQKAILQADVERTRLALERSQMQAEDDRGKVMRDFADLRSRIISRTEMIVALENDIVGLEQERDDISMLNAELEDKFDTILQHSPELIPDLVHTTPNDTEVNDRKKFLRSF